MKKKILVQCSNPGLLDLLKWALDAEDRLILEGPSPAMGRALLEDNSDIALIISELCKSPGADSFYTEAFKNFYDTPLIILNTEDADSHLPWMIEHKIHHHFTLGVPFRTHELRQRVESIFSPPKSILGEPFFEQHEILKTYEILELNSIENVSAEISENYFSGPASVRASTALVELITNAVFYGARKEKSEERLEWNRDFTLSQDNSIKVWVGENDDHIGVGIVDSGGTLDNRTALHWLNRQTSPMANSVPQGLLDTRGRGLFLARKLSDRMLIQVDPGKRSECVIFFSKSKPFSPYKPWSFLEYNN